MLSLRTLLTKPVEANSADDLYLEPVESEPVQTDDFVLEPVADFEPAPEPPSLLDRAETVVKDFIVPREPVPEPGIRTPDFNPEERPDFLETAGRKVKQGVQDFISDTVAEPPPQKIPFTDIQLSEKQRNLIQLGKAGVGTAAATIAELTPTTPREVAEWAAFGLAEPILLESLKAVSPSAYKILAEQPIVTPEMESWIRLKIQNIGKRIGIQPERGLTPFDYKKAVSEGRISQADAARADMEIRDAMIQARNRGMVDENVRRRVDPAATIVPPEPQISPESMPSDSYLKSLDEKYGQNALFNVPGYGINNGTIRLSVVAKKLSGLFDLTAQSVTDALTESARAIQTAIDGGALPDQAQVAGNQAFWGQIPASHALKGLGLSPEALDGLKSGDIELSRSVLDSLIETDPELKSIFPALEPAAVVPPSAPPAMPAEPPTPAAGEFELEPVAKAPEFEVIEPGPSEPREILPEELRAMKKQAMDTALAQAEAKGKMAEAEEPEAASATKEPWEMNPDELDKEIVKAKNNEKQSVIDVFGEDGAKEYEKLYRKSQSSMDFNGADKAYKKLQEMEKGLTKEQENRLFGIGETGLNVDELKDYRDSLAALDFNSAEDLGESLKYKVTKIGEKTDVNEMNHEQKVAYSTLRYAMEKAIKYGFDLKVVGNSALSGAAKRFSDPEDAAFMLKRFMKREGKPVPPEVLKDYPELVKAEPAPETQLDKIKKRARALKGPKSILQFVRANGRINPNIDGGSSDIREFQRIDLMDTKNGKSLGEMAALAREMGYLPKDSVDSDLLDLISRELGGEKIYSERDIDEIQLEQNIFDNPRAKAADFISEKRRLEDLQNERKLTKKEKQYLEEIQSFILDNIEMFAVPGAQEPRFEAVKLGGVVQDQAIIPGTPDRTIRETGLQPKVDQVAERNLLDEMKPDNQPGLFDKPAEKAVEMDETEPVEGGDMSWEFGANPIGKAVDIVSKELKSLYAEARKHKTVREWIDSKPYLQGSIRRKLYQEFRKEKGIKNVSSEIERGEGIHSPADPESGSPLYDLTQNGTYPEDIYSGNGLKYYGTGEEVMDRNAYAILSSVEGRPNAYVKIYRAVEKDGNPIRPGDWVTTVRQYAKEHGEANINGEFKIVSKTVPARDLFTSGDSFLEFGYHPQEKVREFKPLTAIWEKANAPAKQTDTPADPGNPSILASNPYGQAFNILKDAAGKAIKAVTKAPTFYSNLERTIEKKMPERAPAGMVKGIIRDVKKEELDWSGIDQFLEGEAMVTKAEVLEFLKQNEVQVQEVVKGGEPEVKQFMATMGYTAEEFNKLSPQEQRDIWDEFNQTAGKRSGTKFHSYQLPGGENYRELLLTLPEKAQSELDIINARLNEIASQPAAEHKKHPEWRDEHDALVRRGREIQKTPPPFQSSHFDEPNILAHVRFNDRVDADGKKVLFIEEVQSDWHQKGREKGYEKKVKSLPQGYTFAERPERGGKQAGFYVMDTANEAVAFGKTKVEAEKNALEILSNSGVPNAPFKKTWHELALKRMLRYAAENGYDRLAWTTGEQQAERYDLSKEINSIQWSQNKAPGLKNVRIEPKNSGLIRFTVDNDGVIGKDLTASFENKDYIGKNLSDVVGKDIADKILSKNEDTISGSGLKVGGEGMKGFYDQMIPSFLNKYAKKWGAKVGETRINYQESPPSDPMETWNLSGDKVHSLDITPSMKLTVVGEGQPLYSNPFLAIFDELKRLKFDKPKPNLIARAHILKNSLKLEDREWIELKQKVAGKTSLTEMNKDEVGQVGAVLDAVSKGKYTLDEFLAGAAAEKSQEPVAGLSDTERFFGLTKPFPTTKFQAPKDKAGLVRSFGDFVGARSRGAILKDTGELGKAFVDEVDMALRYPTYAAGKFNSRLKEIESRSRLTQDEIFNLKESLEGRQKPMNAAVQEYFSVMNEQRRQIRDMRQKQIAENPAQPDLIKRKESELWGLKNYYHHQIPNVDALKPGEPMRGEVVTDMVRRGAVENVKDAEIMVDEYIRYVKNSDTPETILKYLVKSGQAKDIQDAIVKLNRMRQFSVKFEEGAFMPREIDLPFYDPNPLRVVPNYNRSVMKFLYNTERFGQDAVKLLDLMEKMDAAGGNKEVAQAVLDYVMQKPRGGDFAKIGKFLRDLQVIEKMSYSALSNFWQGRLGTSLILGPKVALKTELKLKQDLAGAKKWAVRVGQNPDMALLYHEDLGDWTRRFLRISQFSKTETNNYVFAATAGKVGAMHYFKRLQKNQKDGEAIRKLKMLGIDPDAALERGFLSDEELVGASDKAWRESQGIPNILNLPQRWLGIPLDSEGGRLLFQFKTVAYNQTRIVWENAVKEAAKGNVSGLIALLILFPAIGEIVEDSKSMITGKQRAQGGLRYLENLSGAFGFGILNDVFWWSKYGISMGPTFAQANELFQAARNPKLIKKQIKNIPFIGRRIYNQMNPPKQKKPKSLDAQLNSMDRGIDRQFSGGLK